MYILKNNHKYTFEKKFVEAFRFVLKIFLGIDSEKSHEYTFEKIPRDRLTASNTFRVVYFENNYECTI